MILCGYGMAVLRSGSSTVTRVLRCAQMGGAKGVRESEQYTLVIGLANGMSMHAVPRRGVMQAHCNEKSPLVSPTEKPYETAAQTRTAA